MQTMEDLLVRRAVSLFFLDRMCSHIECVLCTQVATLMKTMEDLRVSLKQCDEELMLVKKERDEVALKVFFFFPLFFFSQKCDEKLVLVKKSVIR
jgi:hypothetical protein